MTAGSGRRVSALCTGSFATDTSLLRWPLTSPEASACVFVSKRKLCKSFQKFLAAAAASMHTQISKVCTKSSSLGRRLWGVCVCGKTSTVQRGCAGDSREAAAERYGRAFAAARDRPEQYWAEVGQDIRWFEPWSKTLHVEDPVFPNW